MSLYKTAWDKKKLKNVTLEEYVRRVVEGTYQDQVIEARRLRSVDKDKYRAYKAKALPAVSASATYKDGAEDRKKTSIQDLNGFLVIDIDDEVNEELIEQLRADQYTTIIHRSVGGDGVCIFVKINPERFLDAFKGLEKYYLEKYGVFIDASCKDPTRLRFISWDPDLYQKKGAKFTDYLKPQKVQKLPAVIVVKNDFDAMIAQASPAIVDGYEKWLSVGFALASEFGEGGRHYFHTLSRAGYDYNEEKCEKQFNKCLSSSGSGITIKTLFHYFKEAGVEIYSEETKATITTASQYKRIGKKQEDAAKLLKEVKGIEPDEKVIKAVFESREKLDAGLQSDDNISALESFIMDNYQPEYNDLKGIVELYNRSIIINDREYKGIYVEAQKALNFNVTEGDVKAILVSKPPIYNPVTEFFADNEWDGVKRIDSYIDCIHPRRESNRFFFKKWIVGMIHNWVNESKVVSPLTLVMVGQKQGVGKTTFIRNIMPQALADYYIESKLNHNDKDSVKLLTQALLLSDDEFGGKAHKEAEAFKELSDKAEVTMRVPYGTHNETFRRRAALAGTTNNNDILKDPTGNRRLIPILVESIDFEGVTSVDAVQLIMEARKLYDEGFDWKVRGDDMDFLKEVTEEFVEINPAEEVFDKLFFLEERANCVKAIMNKAEFLSVMNRQEERGAVYTKFDIRDILKKKELKYTAHRVDGRIKKGVKVWTHADYAPPEVPEETPPAPF